jgi:hypothetical protein
MPSPRQKALSEFQRYVRYRDSDERGYAKCISCGRVYPVKQMDGGHYEQRSNLATELDEDNVHAQCKRCNGPLQGNTVAYRMRLVERIGVERVSRVEDMAMAYRGDGEALSRLSEEDRAQVRHKRTKKEYETLAKKYRKLADGLAKEKWIV